MILSTQPRKRSNAGTIIALIIIIIIALAGIAYFLRFNLNNIPLPNVPKLLQKIPSVSVAANWAGYEVATNFLIPQPAVQGVSASWTVPSVKNLGTDAFSSVWIGIGGQFDNSLIQVGTNQDITNGSAQYFAWYEMLPNNAVIINTIQVSPGDQMQASISMSNSGNNLWYISIEDVTSNTKFQSNFTYNSQQLTAEWIIERPEVNNAITPLADFGNVTFTNCQASLSGKTGSITDFTYEYVILDPPLATVSSPSNGGTQFTVNYSGG